MDPSPNAAMPDSPVDPGERTDATPARASRLPRESAAGWKGAGAAAVRRLRQLLATRPAWLALPLGLVVGLLTWPVPPLAPEHGIDPSWRAALHYAARERLAFGSDIVFTFGPLGFLTIPKLYFSVTAALSLAFIGLAHLACAISIAYFSVRSSPLWLGLGTLALGVAALPLLAPASLLLVLAVLWAIEALRPGSPRALSIAIPALGAVLAAFAVLVKLNDGLGVAGAIGLVASASAARRDLRPIALYALLLPLSFVVMWLLIGQSLTHLPAFAAGSIGVIRGYSASMGIEVASRAWEYGAAVLVAGAIAFTGASASSSWPTMARVVLALLLIGTGMLAFKHGFVRHDAHSISYFAFMLIVLVPLVDAAATRRAAALSVAFVSVLLVANVSVVDYFDPVPRLENLTRQLTTMTSAQARRHVMETTRATQRATYGLDATTLHFLQSRSVHVHPHETGVIWAYYGVFDWQPLPIFQAYSAYTAELDQMNAEKVRADDAPELVLVGPGASLDGRTALFDSPRATLEMLCNYRELYASGGWQVLERSDDRCGEPRLIDARTFNTGEYIPVPLGGPNEIVYASISGVRDGVAESIRALLYKSEPVWIDMPGRGAFRLVPDTADGPLLMAVPESLAYSPNFAPPTMTEMLRIRYSLTGSADVDELAVHFYAVDLER